MDSKPPATEKPEPAPVAVPRKLWNKITALLATGELARIAPERWPITPYQTTEHIADLHRRMKAISDDKWMKDWEINNPPF